MRAPTQNILRPVSVRARPTGPPRGGLVFGVLLTILGTLAPAPHLYAQEDQEGSTEDTSTGQLWLTYQALRPLGNKRWVLHLQGRTNGPATNSSFASIDGRTRINFYPEPWLDVFPEVLLRYTEEQVDLNSFQVTVRGGIRLKVPSTADLFNREQVPLQRWDLALLTRLEWRNFFYTGGEHDSSWRGRLRLELKVPLNHSSMGEDQTVYARTDAEAFIPLGSESPETYANRWRIRLGAGYRFTFGWRVEALGIVQRSRNTIDEDFESMDTEYMLDLRLRHFF